MNNKVKSILTVAIIIAAGSLAVIFTAIDITTTTGARHAQGLVIDHGGYDVTWLPENNSDKTVKSALDSHAAAGDITIQWDAGKIISLDGISNDDTHKWDLWVVTKGDNKFRSLSGQYNVFVSDYTVCAIAYTTEDTIPMPATDYLGNCFYGIDAKRTVTLSPSITEIVCCVNGVDTIVGSDNASNYPQEFNKRKSDGNIVEVAEFLTISMEKVISVNPDVVFFDGSATNTINIARQIEETTSIKTCVLFPGDTWTFIRDNIFIAGICLGGEYQDVMRDVITKLDATNLSLKEITQTVPESARKSGVVIMSEIGTNEWGAGIETSVRDMIVSMNGIYAFDDLEIRTWSQFNNETLLAKNPDFLIVVSNSYKGADGYHQLMARHADDWQPLKAVQTGNVYLLYDSACDITSRLGPRIIQCTEIFAKIMYPSLFAHDIQKNYIGNDYTDYLEYSKEALF